MDIQYWDRELETIDRPSLEKLQLERLRATVDWALRTPFYKNRMAKHGIASGADIRTLDDVQRVPYTTKDDLREAYPDKLLAVDQSEVVRVHTSSGTTGTPTAIYHNRHDLDQWTNLVARSLVSIGATPRDVFQNMMTYGLFTGGLGLHYGAEKIGLMIIPAGPGNTLRQLKLMRDFGTTLLHATPSYLLHIADTLAAENISRSSLVLRAAVVGAEPHSEDTRRKIEQLLRITVYNCYGLSEMNGPGVAFECTHQDGLHLWEDAYILEMIDPETLAPVPEGGEGELVLTTLNRQATPLLRYRTKDLSRINGTPCPCGRTHRRIARIKGRTDDMLIINGVNMYPSQVEEVLMRVPEVGTNYQIVLEKHGAMDKLTVKTEIFSKMFTGDIQALDRLKAKIKDHLRAAILINPAVELHEPGSLPVSEGKAKRVIDLRPKF
jgi:phenylacetate-CoA ligase